MEMAIFPVNRKVAQEAWRRTLTVRPWSSSYGMLMICANVFCVSAFATLGRYAYLKKAGVESISFSMAAGLLFLLLGGAFMFRLYRGVRRLLAESEGEKYFEDLEDHTGN